jgi:hypothetical protein
MMHHHQILDAVVVADHGTLEPPFAAQHIVQQPIVGMRGYAVYFVVGRHHRTDVGAANDFLEGREEILAQRALGNAGGSHIGAAFGLTMPREMLEGGEYLAVGQRQYVALQAAHGGHAKLRYKVRIFAEGLLDATPARVASDINDGRKNFAYPADTDLATDDGIDLQKQVGVPAAGQGNGLGEIRGINGCVAVKPFLVQPHGNTQPGLLHGEMLDGIDHLHRLARIAPMRNPRRSGAVLIGGPGESAETVRILDCRFRGIEIEILVEYVRFVFPDGHHLGDFFFQSHATEEIVDAGIHVRLRIFVNGPRSRQRQTGSEYRQHRRGEAQPIRGSRHASEFTH